MCVNDHALRAWSADVTELRIKLTNHREVNASVTRPVAPPTIQLGRSEVVFTRPTQASRLN